MERSTCVAVEILDDMLYEGNEMFTFMLSNPLNATLVSPSEVTITIIDTGE